jgi:hypothetical protein
MDTKTMQDIHLCLPADLVREAETSGLLSASELEPLLREELRKRRVAKLFEAADRLAALPGQPLTAEEVAAEIAEVRRARRLADAGRS